jgi:hypothetical protein
MYKAYAAGLYFFHFSLPTSNKLSGAYEITMLCCLSVGVSPLITFEPIGTVS